VGVTGLHLIEADLDEQHGWLLFACDQLEEQVELLLERYAEFNWYLSHRDTGDET